MRGEIISGRGEKKRGKTIKGRKNKRQMLRRDKRRRRSGAEHRHRRYNWISVRLGGDKKFLEKGKRKKKSIFLLLLLLSLLQAYFSGKFAWGPGQGEK